MEYFNCIKTDKLGVYGKSISFHRSIEILDLSLMPSDVSSEISLGVFIEWGTGRGVNGSLWALPFVVESRVTFSDYRGTLHSITPSSGAWERGPTEYKEGGAGTGRRKEARSYNGRLGLPERNGFPFRKTS